MKRLCGLSAIALFLASLLVWSADRAVAADWPGFRGPNGNGTSNDAGVPTEWSDSKNLKWKLKLPGKGFSSPIVVGGRVFVTAWSGTGDQTQRHLVCVDRETGKPLWTRTIDGVSDGQESGFAYHGNASHTPVSDGERVYVMLGSSGVHAFDLDGNELWKQDVGGRQLARFGTASSPILHGDHLIVTAGAESETMRAFDKRTGKEVWKTEAASLSGTYSTPLVVTNPDGEEELVLSVTGEVWGINPANGKLRWYAETSVDTAACPSVIAEDGVVYVIGGRGGGRTAVRTGGKNDVTESHVLWSKSGGSYVPSPILHEGRLYWINDRGIANCVDAETGEEISQERVGGRYYASIVMIGDKFYAVSRFDGVRVLEASPEFKQVAHNKLSDESDFSGSPAVSDGQLIIRSDEALYCIAAEK
jgi:outer membrane protein assembly factor BamB